MKPCLSYVETLALCQLVDFGAACDDLSKQAVIDLRDASVSFIRQRKL